MSEDRETWPYWREKYGSVRALEIYFPKTLKADARLVAAVVQIESAKLLIDKIMDEDQ